MTIFAAADAVLHADANLSIPATYRQRGMGEGVAVRIIRSAASDLVAALGRQMRATEGGTISVLAADCSPGKGDTWTLADDTILTAIDAERLAEGTSYTVTVR